MAYQVWDDEITKTLVKLYHQKDRIAVKEIAYRLNTKFDLKLTTAAVGQRLNKLRRDEVLEARDAEGGNGSISEEGAAFQDKIDKSARHAREKKKNGETAPRKKRPSSSGKDVLLESDTRVIRVDLGSKGSVTVELSGPILLNDELVTGISEVVAKVMAV